MYEPRQIERSGQSDENNESKAATLMQKDSKKNSRNP